VRREVVEIDVSEVVAWRWKRGIEGRTIGQIRPADLCRNGQHCMEKENRHTRSYCGSICDRGIIVERYSSSR